MGTHQTELTGGGKKERGKLEDVLPCKIMLIVTAIAWILSNVMFVSSLYQPFLHLHCVNTKFLHMHCVNTKYPQCVYEFLSCISSFIVTKRLASEPISTTLPGGYLPSTKEIYLPSSKVWSLTQFLVRYTASKKVAASLLLLNLEVLNIIQGTKTLYKELSCFFFLFTVFFACCICEDLLDHDIRC